MVLAVLVVAGLFRLFGGYGVLALGIIATAVWIAQIMASTRTVRDHLENRPSDSDRSSSPSALP